MKPWMIFALIGFVYLLGISAINSRVWQECTQKGMSGFYCFMQLK